VPAKRNAHVTGLTILYHHRTRARDGQSVHIDEMIDAMRATGNRVVVVGPRRVSPMTTPIESRLLPRAVYELVEFSYSFVEFAKLAAAAIRYRPDALYERANLLMLSGVWAASLFRLPYLLEVNAPLAEERARYGGLAWPGLAALTERACWRAASMVLPVTGVLAAYVKRAGVPAERITITPNGVDTEKFRPRNTSEARARLGLGQSLVLGFVGHIREWHGLDVMIEVLARPALAHAHLLIVGDGPARPALEKRARRLGMPERVHFTGTMPRESLPELTSCIDIALQPNVTPYASPLKLFEYMAAARAIVAPASPNIREILEDDVDGVLFAPGSAEAMAGAIERLVGDAALRERFGKAAARKIAGRNLTWRGNAERAVAIVRKLRAPAGLAAEPAGS
jgi:glycosyltransferase involved in cell wall biosynthesis